MTRSTITFTLIAILAGTSAHAVPPGRDRDFDDDGFDDLAIGVPFESRGPGQFGGAINVLYGTASVLTADDDEFLHQERLGLGKSNDSGDNFGFALAVGDFDGDGNSDLAVGSPGEHIDPGAEDAGIVHILYGFTHGLRLTNVQHFSQATEGMSSEPRDDEKFGSALAAADFNDDGFDDLAIGVPNHEVTEVSDAGAVHILYGSPMGLTADAEQFWHRDIPGIEGTPADQDEFGEALDVGDFNGDGFDDLAITAFGAEVHGFDFAGAVHILFGSSNGLTSANDQLWSQRSPGIADSPESLEFFGRNLATGDFDDDGFDDLAIGVDESLATAPNCGAVHVLHGTSNGLSADNADFLHQDRNGIPDDPENSDRFGWALAAGNFDGDRFDDLAIGVRGEGLPANISEAGAVHVLFGSRNGVKKNGNLFFTQDTQGLDSVPEVGDHFGDALSAGDFNGDGFDDLVIASTGDVVSVQEQAGAVHVLYGSEAGPSPFVSQFWHQDVPGVKDIAEANDRFGSALGR